MACLKLSRAGRDVPPGLLTNKGTTDEFWAAERSSLHFPVKPVEPWLENGFEISLQVVLAWRARARARVY